MSSTAFVNGSTLSDAGWANDVDTSTYNRLTSVSGTNTIVGTGPVSMTAYAVGQYSTFIPAATNTGPATMNVTPSGASALGARNIFSNGVALIGGELKIGVPVIIWDDGTQFNLVGGTPGQLLGRERIQLGASGTATQNFVFGVPASPDGTIKLARGNDGATTSDIWTVNAAGLFTFRGTATNDSAAAGFNGEYQESVVASTTTGVSDGTPLNATSLSLTAGDWDVSGVVVFRNAGSTDYHYSMASINTVSATIGSESQTTKVTLGIGQTGDNYASPATPTPVVRMLLSATTTVYLVGQLGFSGSTFGIGGTLRARRMR